jgi:transposase
MIRNKPRNAAVYGVDIGKNIFHVVGTDPSGQIVQRAKFRRETVLAFFQQAAPILVGMEACPGAQWLARKLQAMGHTVRVVPAQFVKPYVKSNKNDMIDAAAIAEAITRPTMRFVEVKTPEQVDIQALHRIREQMVRNRTRLICQMRASAWSTASLSAKAPASSSLICRVSSATWRTISRLRCGVCSEICSRI